MDKRWIYIIIIFILGCACLFFVASHSSTIGVANVNIGKTTMTIPDSYNIEQSNAKFVKLVNRKTNEKIIVKDLGKGSHIQSSITSKMDELADNESISLIEDINMKKGNLTLPGIHYEKLPDNADYYEYYFTKLDHTFSIKLENFNDNFTDDINPIIDSLRRDPKQKPDE